MKKNDRLGRRLKKWRKEELGFTMHQLVVKLNISQGSWCDLEHGNSYPAHTTLRSILRLMRRLSREDDFMELIFGPRRKP